MGRAETVCDSRLAWHGRVHRDAETQAADCVYETERSEAEKTEGEDVMYCIDDRIDIANRMIATFAPGTTLMLEAGYVAVRWTSRGNKMSRRWMTRGQDFYPVWHRTWGHGGTASTALSQLVRWIRGKPVLPASTWEYWASKPCMLLRQADWRQPLEDMVAAGYPTVAKCVLCGQDIVGGMDWWHLGRISGPCCSMRSGCKQERSLTKIPPRDNLTAALPAVLKTGPA